MATPNKFYSSTFVANKINNGGGISSGATSFFCLTTPTGAPSSFPFELVLDEGTASEELVLVNSGSGTSGTPWNVTRGHDGSTAKSHSNGATVNHPFCADDLTKSRLHESLDSTTGTQPHGLPMSAWVAAPFTKIQDVTLSNSTTSVVTWSSIPGTYAHLLVVAHGRLTSTAAQDGSVSVTINGDTGSHYQMLNINTTTESGSQSGPNNGNSFGQTGWNSFIAMAAAQAGSSVNAGGGFMLFPNYAGTTLNKMAVGMSGYGNGTSIQGLAMARWGFYNPGTQVAITSLSLSASIGNFVSGSRLCLYGMG